MSSTSKNPVKAAFKLVQQDWGKAVSVTSWDCEERPQPFTFRYQDIVGNGTFGIVCRAQDLLTNETVAIKTVYQDEGHQNRELSIIKSLNHPNIVGLKRYFYKMNSSREQFLSLVLEYVPTSLDRILKEHEKNHEPIPLILIQLCMYQFMQALQYLHEKGICHRDIKPHNLLIDSVTGHVKLCDFGCSKRLIDGEPNISYICARYYRAPEIVFGSQHYTCAIDMWSAGCVMAELFTGKPMFPGKNSVDQLAKIVKILGPPTLAEQKAMGQEARKFKSATAKARNLDDFFPSTVPSAAVQLITAMLQYDPKTRITPHAALQHAFFADLFRPNSVLPSGHPIPPLHATPQTSCAQGSGNENGNASSLYVLS